MAGILIPAAVQRGRRPMRETTTAPQSAWPAQPPELLPAARQEIIAPASDGAPRAVCIRHRWYLELEAAPAAVPYARRCTRQTLTAWKLAHIADDTELIVSELVTNSLAATAAMQAAAPVALYLAADPDRLTVLVWDASPELPARRPAGDSAVSGRGLEIVGALSDIWGTCVTEQGGKVVWAWLSLDC